MNKLKNLSLGLFSLGIFSLGLISCSKPAANNPTGATPTTVSEDKENITNTFNNTTNNIKMIQNGDFVKGFSSFMNMQNGQAMNMNWISNMFSKLTNSPQWQTASNAQTNGRFNLAPFAANTYSWNALNKAWDISPNTNGALVLSFPSDSTIAIQDSMHPQNANDIVFTLSKYTDESHTFNNETDFIPTAIAAQLVKGTEKLFSLNYTGTYNSGMPVPQDAKIDLFLAPNDYSFEVKQNSPTQFELMAGMLNGTPNALSMDAKINLSSSDYAALDLNNDITSLQLTWAEGNFNVNGTFNIAAYNALPTSNTLTAAQINSTINFDVNYNNQKIGNLVFKADPNSPGQSTMVIVYKDGTSDSTATYLRPFATSVSNLANNTLGNAKAKALIKETYLQWKIANLKTNVTTWIKSKVAFL